MNPDPASGSVTLYSSWRGLAASFISPSILLLVGISSWAVTGTLSILAIVLISLGTLIVAVSLFDMPRRTVFDATGVHRACLLRRHDLEWTALTALVRAPGPIVGGVRDEEASRFRRSRGYGGLAAQVGRRRYLLVDQAEAPEEFEAVREIIATHSPATAIRTNATPAGTTPTFTYQRRS